MIETRLETGAVADRLAVAWTDPVFAVMVTEPEAAAVANPEALTDATPELDELHWTELVTFLVVPSERLAVAENCCEAPTAIELEVGEIWSEVMVGDTGDV